MAPVRPSYGRALSLVPEGAASAKEEVLYTVIGEDAWIFVEKVVTECAKRFPTLAGTRTSTLAAANQLGTSSNSKGVPPKPRVSAKIDVVEADEAPYSCKFWFDGMKELSGGDDQSEDESDTMTLMTVEDIPAGDPSFMSSSTATSCHNPPGLLTSSHNAPALLATEDPVTLLSAEDEKVFLAVTPTSSPCRSVHAAPTASCDSIASTSSAIKGHKIGMEASTSLPGQERKHASFAAGVPAAGEKPSTEKAPKAARISTRTTSSQHSKGKMSISSAISSITKTLTRNTVSDDFGEEAKRTVVGARYYPVEKFSEEVPICRTLKQFKDSIMLFVLDERNEEVNSNEEKLQNLERRKGEVERWMMKAMQHHHLGGAPAMLCIFLVHDEYAPGSFHKMHTTMTQASLKVNMESEANCLPGRASSNSASFRPLNSNGSASKGAVKEVAPLTHAEKLRAFSEELRRLTKADEDDVLQYACNFDDPDAMLKFIVTMSNDIIERRKHDFLTKPDDFEDKKPSRCRCSCVVA